MIAHPGLDRLRAFADDRLPSPGRRRTANHLAGCSRCRETVAWIREVGRRARETVDEGAPQGAWDRIAERVRAGETVLLPTVHAAPAGTRPWYRTGAFRAAVLVLAFAGAASAAVPDSPVRSWLGRLLPLPTLSEAPPTEPDAARPTGAPAGAPPETALHVSLVVDTLAIEIEGADPRLRIRVRSTEAAEVEVRASGGAAAALFRTGRGRLAIADAGAGEITLLLPRSARRITLEVDGRRYLTKERGQLRLSMPIADTAGAEIVLPGRP